MNSRVLHILEKMKNNNHLTIVKLQNGTNEMQHKSDLSVNFRIPVQETPPARSLAALLPQITQIQLPIHFHNGADLDELKHA